MLKNYGLSSDAFLTKWTNLTKDNLELQWPLWGTLDLPKLVFLWTKLEDCVNRTKHMNGIAILLGN